MAEITLGVSWIGVIVGAVAAFILGYFWYSPTLFGKKWAQSNGIELNTADKMPFLAMALQVTGLLLMSWFVGVTAVESRLLTFILALLAFVVLHGSSVLFTKKPHVVAHIDGGYWIAAGVLMFISQAIF